MIHPYSIVWMVDELLKCKAFCEALTSLDGTLRVLLVSLLHSEIEYSRSTIVSSSNSNTIYLGGSEILLVPKELAVIEQ